MARPLLLFCMLVSCQGEAPEPETAPAPTSPVVQQPLPESRSLRARPAADAEPSALPPIVLLTLDTTRADHLGTYGYFRDTSPNLDHLASMSLVFDDAIAPMATTLPTHLSLMTGLTPLEHGTTANVMHGGTRFVPGEGVQTLAQLLTAAGYQTAAFVSATPLESGTGVERGFQTFGDPKSKLQQADKTVNLAIQWLQQADLSRPWFLWVHFYDPHNPYWPQEPWKSKFVGDGDQESWLAEREFSESSIRPGKPEEGRVTGEVVQTVPANDGYDGEIAFMDAQIGRLMLEVARYRIKPIILVVGDHGEGLGQHDQPGHGRVWNEQLRVPLMLHMPGLAPGRHAATVGVVDVLPTLLGRLEVPGAEAILAQASGVDVLAEDAEPRVVFSMQSDRQVHEFGEPPTAALTAADWKLIVAEGEPAQLYDRQSDPYELRPTPGASRVVQLETLRAAQLEKAEALGARGETAVSEESLEALRALGYLE